MMPDWPLFDRSKEPKLAIVERHLIAQRTKFSLDDLNRAREDSLLAFFFSPTSSFSFEIERSRANSHRRNYENFVLNFKRRMPSLANASHVEIAALLVQELCEQSVRSGHNAGVLVNRIGPLLEAFFGHAIQGLSNNALFRHKRLTIFATPHPDGRTFNIDQLLTPRSEMDC